MKKFNLIIPDNRERLWDLLVKNKKESNVNDTILRLIEEEVNKVKGETKQKDG